MLGQSRHWSHQIEACTFELYSVNICDEIVFLACHLILVSGSNELLRSNREPVIDAINDNGTKGAHFGVAISEAVSTDDDRRFSGIVAPASSSKGYVSKGIDPSNHLPTQDVNTKLTTKMDDSKVSGFNDFPSYFV